MLTIFYITSKKKGYELKSTIYSVEEGSIYGETSIKRTHTKLGPEINVLYFPL